MLDTIIEHFVTEDFDQFDFSDEPMKKYCTYNRTKHIQMATQLVRQRFENEAVIDWTEIEDYIHGLNHIFYNGVAAGQTFEWRNGKDGK